MNAHGPKSIVSPEIVVLSVFITPWTNPMFIQCAIRAAWRSATERSSASAGCGSATRSGSWRSSA